jgi:FKBP-type peptidyl-prolyl cis-trans isomerase
MKPFFVCLLLLGVLVLPGCGGKKVSVENQKEKFSYSVGLNIGGEIRKDSVSFDIDALTQGIKDALADSSKRLMTPEQAQQAITAYQKEMMTRRAETNLKEGQAFLEENKKKEGVITLPSGLQYKVITAGDGKTPRKDQTVMTQYRGTLIDGKEFDSSYRRGVPATFVVSEVIPGWTEALQLMPVGSRWMLFVPPGLAYGDMGRPPVIGPNATLIFEIQLLGIK